jgi:hypothetical protein
VEVIDKEATHAKNLLDEGEFEMLWMQNRVAVLIF